MNLWISLKRFYWCLLSLLNYYVAYYCSLLLNIGELLIKESFGVSLMLECLLVTERGNITLVKSYLLYLLLIDGNDISWVVDSLFSKCLFLLLLKNESLGFFCVLDEHSKSLVVSLSKCLLCLTYVRLSINFWVIILGV